ncbi:MAG: hypothetical protein ACLQGP_26360 [Isosphaeraceae bacterium]
MIVGILMGIHEPGRRPRISRAAGHRSPSIADPDRRSAGSNVSSHPTTTAMALRGPFRVVQGRRPRRRAERSACLEHSSASPPVRSPIGRRPVEGAELAAPAQ